MVILVMGAAGAGKTTIGTLLAQRLGYRFLDADVLHSPANMEKMSAGVPLTDEDRRPWLQALASEIDAALAREEDLVIACSALRRSYRERLVRDPERVRLVYLRGTPALLEARLRARIGHPVGVNLLPSQLGLLEVPEDAITVDIDSTPAEIVDDVLRQLRT